MRHHDTKRKFGREAGARDALLAGLARTLIERGAITTTLAKAKSLRPMVEKLVTKGKTDSLSSRRLVMARLGGPKSVANRLFEKVAPALKDRQGGYLRIVKLGQRSGDASPMARIEFTENV